MANHNCDVNAQEVPFFTRYLEGEIIEDISEKDAKKINGGASPLMTSTSSSGWWYAVVYKCYSIFKCFQKIEDSLTTVNYVVSYDTGSDLPYLQSS